MVTTKAKTTEQKKSEEQRFEFVFYINNKIICQRYVNIKDFNEESLSSIELKELMDNICGMNLGQYGDMGIIPKHLKNKSVDYLWSEYRPYLYTQETLKNIYDKIDDFQFEIKVDKNIVAKAMFSGNCFPTKVRYAVDIKEIIPSIMSEIRHYLSQKNYTKVTQ